MDPVTLGMAKLAARKTQRQWVRPYSDRTRPWYIDVFWPFFRGNRLAAAVASILTTADYSSSSTLTSTAAANATTLSVADGTRFRANEFITVNSGAGVPGQRFFVTSVSSNTLTITPVVPTSIPSGAKVSSLWYNTYHLGLDGSNDWGYYVANAKQYEAMPGINLISYGGFDSNYTDANGVANVPVGMESLTVNTTCADYSNWATAEVQNRSRTGKSTTVTSTQIGGGLRTKDSIPVAPGDNINASLIAIGSYYTITVVDKANPGTVISTAIYSRTTGSGVQATAAGERQVCEFVVPAGVRDIELRITGLTAGGGTVTIEDLRIVKSRQSPLSQRYIIEDPRGGNIVLMGDSWTAGQCGTALAAALAVRFPGVSVINKGVPGDRLDQMIARFTTDCVPYDPVYVIWQWGANDVGNTYSVNTMVNNAQVANDITRAIGAIPVHTGIPPCGDSSTITLARDANEAVRTRIDACTI